MIARSKQMDVDDAEPGMVLSQAVLDAHGAVLIPADAVLTESMLTALRRRGIDYIPVVDDAVPAAELEAERQRVQQRLDLTFRRCGQTGGGAAFLRFVAAYRLGQLK